MGKKPMAHIIKVNKYENPKMALDLIAHICTASEDIDISPYFVKYNNLLKQLEETIAPYSLMDNNFIKNCYAIADEMKDKLLQNVSSTLKIAVAGGYSAGKSSLLNKLTGVGDLLPTGVEPVSVVNTFLNCVPAKRKLIIRGKNLEGNMVLLNDEVLACIQHSSKSKVYIASVLKNIIIDVPTPQYLERITFVDTPGYNNSTSDSEADRETALTALNEADAIFWCIDIESGTINATDLEMLKNVSDKPVVIIFTKMDKKDMSSVRNIVSTTEKAWLAKFGIEHMPIAIVAVSCQNKKIYSSGHYTFKQIIEDIKKKCGAYDILKLQQQKIDDDFQLEIDASNEQIAHLEEKRKTLVKTQNEANNSFNSYKEYVEYLKKQLHEILIDNYNEIMECADKRFQYFDLAMSELCDALNREIKWEDKSGWLSDTSGLLKERQRSGNKYDTYTNVDLSYTYWKEKDRNELIKNIEEELDSFLNIMSEGGSFDEYDDVINEKKKEGQLIKCLLEYRQKVLRALQESYYDSKQEIEKHNKRLQTIEEHSETDVFSAISGDNYERFLACFSNGIDLNTYNKEGFSPLTWAVRSGNNEMVKFFINHDADLKLKDKRGYNALETATICHYQDICELLIEADNMLINSSCSLVELSRKNNFEKWILQIK